MKYPKIPILFLAAAMSTATLAIANDDDDEEPFEEARLFFELNDTDGDLGIHGKIDGDEWKYLEIEDPRDRKMMHVWVRGRLRRQGLTELFFESAEPTFDELNPARFFRRFPEGEYDIEGITLDGEERESEVYLSHVIPAAPGDVKVNGEPVEEDECVGVESSSVTLSWGQVVSAHEELGDPLPEATDLPVRYYEVVVEIDESDFKSVAIIPPGNNTTVSWTLAESFFLNTDEDEYKFEILVRTNILDEDGEIVMAEVEAEDEDGNPITVEVPVPGNKSAMESCFEFDD